jgi:hypothetical protein
LRSFIVGSSVIRRPQEYTEYDSDITVATRHHGDMTQITAKLTDGFVVKITNGQHEWSADDCENCDDDATGMIDHITSNVHIEGDFDDAQRKRIAQIATRCPVHKTLSNGIQIEDNATFDAG